MWQLLKFCEKRRTAHVIWFSMKRRLHPPSVQYWSDTVWNKTLCAPSPAEFLPLFLHLTVLNCLFSFYIFFYPVWQSVDTRTHLRMLELWTILISPGLTDWDIPQVYLVLYFLFPFMLTEDSDVFVVYFFFCVDWVSGACFFVINGLKVAYMTDVSRLLVNVSGAWVFFCKYPVDIITECLNNYCIFVEDAW